MVQAPLDSLLIAQLHRGEVWVICVTIQQRVTGEHPLPSPKLSGASQCEEQVEGL